MSTAVAYPIPPFVGPVMRTVLPLISDAKCRHTSMALVLRPNWSTAAAAAADMAYTRLTGRGQGILQCDEEVSACSVESVQCILLYWRVRMLFNDSERHSGSANTGASSGGI